MFRNLVDEENLKNLKKINGNMYCTGVDLG